MKLSSQLVFSMIRWGLTAVGAALANKGFIDGQQSPELIGAAMTIVSAVWSVVHHTTTTPIPNSAVASVQDQLDRMDPPH